ncbi:MAG: 16S rRNA (guanine(966)-N(2))-methyltransferase RsmD [Polyangiaceae bacterium]
MRITGGHLRSRRLEAPKGDATRPTADRVREALFSILSSRHTLAGMRVLDLYGGTGALGFEAISRGAEHATFVEAKPDVVRVLQRNAESLGILSLVSIVSAKVERARPRIAGVYDLVFVDPPYADVRSGRTAEALLPYADVFARVRELVLEHASADSPAEISGCSLMNTRTYGDTALSFYAPEFGSSGD